MCGVEKWDPVSVWYSQVDYEALMNQIKYKKIREIKERAIKSLA